MDPAKQPDSILEAAKKTAAALGLNWPTLELIYRDLQKPDEQGDSWLPKSSGRSIWSAHPHYVARLLIAFGFRSPRITPHLANFIARGLTPEGRALSMADWPSAGSVSLVEDLFRQLLTDPAAADEIAQLRFDPAEKSLTVIRRDGAPGLRLMPATDGFWTEGFDPFRDKVRAALSLDTSARVGSALVIDGAVLSEIARTVNWRTDWPARPARPDEGDE